ncbi:hypothetical protein [Deinococcus radiophilus]|uniref:hypothetical protein n=1 Tax=Deinococcus radiophilus TaxID=32062 RepID=UPI00147398C7|nr:hypothetical protein [Deinococcus radiophilus]UFA49533.1 hypothetical protein LMT64_06380 [Deinococcus radiophilus]
MTNVIYQSAAFFLGVALLLGLSLWLWATADDVRGWQTWLFRAGHQVLSVEDQPGGSRSVAFVLRPGEEVGRAVQGCAHSFGKMLLQDGTFVHCVAYGSAADAEMALLHPELVCEQGRAVQMTYASAQDAQILVNRGEACAPQPNYLPEYVRPYT